MRRLPARRRPGPGACARTVALARGAQHMLAHHAAGEPAQARRPACRGLRPRFHANQACNRRAPRPSRAAHGPHALARASPRSARPRPRTRPVPHLVAGGVSPSVACGAGGLPRRTCAVPARLCERASLWLAGRVCFSHTDPIELVVQGRGLAVTLVICGTPQPVPPPSPSLPAPDRRSTDTRGSPPRPSARLGGARGAAARAPLSARRVAPAQRGPPRPGRAPAARLARRQAAAEHDDRGARAHSGGGLLQRPRRCPRAPSPHLRVAAPDAAVAARSWLPPRPPQPARTRARPPAPRVHRPGPWASRWASTSPSRWAC